MRIQCGCKVNLYLRIMAKRENGYHDLETLFYPLSIPFDVLDIQELDSKHLDTDVAGIDVLDTKELKVEELSSKELDVDVLSSKELEVKKPEIDDQKTTLLLPSASKHTSVDNISVECETKGIDLKDNTLTKAYELYANTTGFSPKIHITLEKGIPHGAGLGGGSSDAAALLMYLQKKNPSPLSQEELIKLSAKIGADVPFFLLNIPCKAKGIGEILEPVTLDVERLYLVLVTPYIQINTKKAFLKLDELKKDLTVMDSLGRNGRSYSLQEFFWENDFEIPVFLEYPHLGEIKKELIRLGASVALLSGSGSSIFGLFRSLERARSTFEILKETFDKENSAKIYDPIEIL